MRRELPVSWRRVRCEPSAARLGSEQIAVVSHLVQVCRCCSAQTQHHKLAAQSIGVCAGSSQAPMGAHTVTRCLLQTDAWSMLAMLSASRECWGSAERTRVRAPITRGAVKVNPRVEEGKIKARQAKGNWPARPPAVQLQSAELHSSRNLAACLRSPSSCEKHRQQPTA